MKILALTSLPVSDFPIFEKALAEWSGKILWEVASGQDRAHAPDHEHIFEVIAHFRPDLILAFGRLLAEAAKNAGCSVLEMPSLTLNPQLLEKRLTESVATLREFLANYKPQDEYTICGHTPKGQLHLNPP